jgi:hypothetical protein
MDWMWWLQIGADGFLLLVVALLLFRLRGLGKLNQMRDEKEWEEFIKQAGDISMEFDRLLNEKRELVSRTLKGLDQRIEELKSMQGSVGPAIVMPAVEKEKPPEPKPRDDVEPIQESRIKSAAKLTPQAMEEFRSTVLELAEDGQKARQIAKSTGRPQGEVELILRLNDQEV